MMMLSLFNPWVLLALICFFLGVGAVAYTKGQDDERERQQLEIAALNAKARETEQRMGEVAQTYAQTLRKANDVAKAKENMLRSDIATGKRKLFIPIQTTECAIHAPTDTAPAAGNNSRETSAELTGQAANDLIAIASEGDAAIRKLNACITQYDQMRNMK
jgi:LAS superfamily LD-carboxypeptidase LdcB